MENSSWAYIAIVALIILSAFFSGSEIAFASANKLRLKKAAEKGGSAKVAYEISEDYDQALSAILIGNNLVNIAASSVATVIAMSIFGPNSSRGPAMATTVMTFLILIFGEITPKIVAKRNCDSFSIAVAKPLKLVMIIFSPVNKVVLWIVGKLHKVWGTKEPAPTVTEEELSSLIDIIGSEGVIDEGHTELLQSALEFSDITAQEILTPRVDMEAIDIEDSPEEIRDKIFNVPHSRIPVYRGNMDRIVGILFVDHYFKALVDDPSFTDISSLLMAPCYVPRTMKLPALMAELRDRKTQLAVVLDEYGGTMGIVTMEDAVEQLVGEIWDETDEIVSDITQLSDTDYKVSGDMSIYDFFDFFSLTDTRESQDYTTAGSWAIEILDGYPQPGDSFDFENLTVTIDEMEELRVKFLRVKMNVSKDEEEN